ncbi:MAG: MarR family transcriptional regulator [Chloroflexota bacterium]
MNKPKRPLSMPDIFQRIEGVGKKLKRMQRQTIQTSGLTPPQFFLLTLLWERDRRPFKELAEASGYTPATITGIVDTMEKKGVVRRENSTEDRRSCLVVLTEKGRGLQQTTPSLDKIFKHCCVGLSPDEIQQLGELLDKLDRSLES